MFIDNLLELNNCLICRIDEATELGMCDFCNTILPWISKIKYRCEKCQKELSTKETFICDICNAYHDDYNKIFTIFSYQEPIKKLLLDLKFRQKLAYADFLGKILYQFVITNWYKHKSLPEILIPMPLHAKRLRNRGFNQAFELSRNIAKKITINHTACTRIKNTIKQTSLLKSNRNINIKHAFIADKLPYNHIAILDDVITTGSTVRSLCYAIRKHNASVTIDLWCIARA